MKDLIAEEINHIKNLEERVIFKELLNGVFLSLYEKNLEMYENLEKKIFQEISFDDNQYTIMTGLMERKYFDASHHLLFPILERDMETIPYNLDEILNLLKEGNKINIMQVFLECDYLKVKEILKKDNIFLGFIKTNRGTYQTKFGIRQCNDYMKELEHLYQLFIRNSINWRTVNAPYIYKIADVYIEQCEASLEEIEQILEISIDFLEYNQFVKYNVVPVWNIKRQLVDSVGFPMPCEDHKNYEHIISIHDFGVHHAYLVDNDEFKIEQVQKIEDKLYIISETDEVQQWNIYMIHQGESKKIDRYTYPILSNQKKETFAERLYNKYKLEVKTKAELIRFIESFDLNDFLLFDHYEIADYEEKIEEQEDNSETYSMNLFIKDEIRLSSAKKKFIIYMKAINKNSFLLRDLLSFLISEIQMFYPEYICEGKLYL